MTRNTTQPVQLSQQTTELLVFTITQIVRGFSEPRDVTAVLRRVCAESRGVQPEAIVLRIKALWTKVTPDAGGTHAELDRRYSSLIGKCLAIYHEQANGESERPQRFVPHTPTGRAEPDTAAPPT